MSLLPPVLRGVISLTLFVANLVFWIIPFYAIAIVKLVPGRRWRDRCLAGLERIAALWIDGNDRIAGLHNLEFDVRGVDGLRMDDWYLVSSNHQSWADVFALQHALNRRIPFLRFFLKRQLIWVPLLGLAWWAMELPFVERHSKEALARNPELRKRDIARTYKACETCRGRPTSIMNFLEGTRFTPAKHAAQGSPYRYLLEPKAGGVAFAMSAVGDVLQNFLDVTIVYSPRGASFWDLMCGRVSRIVVDVRQCPIPAELFAGDYANSAADRARFKDWVTELWRAKDERIARLSAAT